MKKLRYFIGTIFILCMIACFPSMAATTVRLPLIVEEDYNKAQELLSIINDCRKNVLNEHGLQMDSKLQEIAMLRAAELAVCFDHGRPNGSGLITATYKEVLGENTAKGQGIAQLVFNDWRSSALHNACMVADTAEYCGIGCVTYESTRFWVLLTSKNAMGSISTKTGIVNVQKDVEADISRFKFYIWDWKLPDEEIYVNTNGIYYGASQQAGIFIHDFYDDGAVGCRMYPQMLLYSTDTPGILSVAADGTVTPKKTGEGSINVALKDYPSVKTTIPVSVIANTWKGSLTINMVGGSNYTYTGQPVTPGFDIRDCFGLQLVKDRDYRVEYSNNTNPGTATARIKLIGNYACPGLSAILGFDADVYTRNFYISGGASGTDNGNAGAVPGDSSINSGGSSTGTGIQPQPTVSPVSGSTAGMGISPPYDDSGGTVSAKLKKAAVSSVKVTGKGKASVRWQKKAGISGYEVQYALNKKFTQDVKTKRISGQKKTGVTLKKLKGKKTYYVRVRTYKKSKGKVVYSKWSGIKKVRIK